MTGSVKIETTEKKEIFMCKDVIYSRLMRLVGCE